MSGRNITLDGGPSQCVDKDAWWNMIASVYNFLSASTALAQALDNKYMPSRNVFDPNKTLLIEEPKDLPEITEISPSKVIDEGLVAKMIIDQDIPYNTIPRLTYVEQDILNTKEDIIAEENFNAESNNLPITTIPSCIGDNVEVAKDLESMHLLETAIIEKQNLEQEALLLNLIKNDYKPEQKSTKKDYKIKSDESDTDASSDSTALEFSDSDHTINSAAMDTYDTNPGSACGNDNTNASLSLGSDPVMGVASDLQKIINDIAPGSSQIENQPTNRRFDGTLKAQIAKKPEIQQELIQFSREKNPITTDNIPNTIQELKDQLAFISQNQGKGANKKEVYNHILKISDMVTKLENEQQKKIKSKFQTNNKEIKSNTKEAKETSNHSVRPSSNMTVSLSVDKSMMKNMCIEKAIKKITIENLKKGQGVVKIEQKSKKSKKKEINLKMIQEILQKNPPNGKKGKPVTRIIKDGRSYIAVDGDIPKQKPKQKKLTERPPTPKSDRKFFGRKDLTPVTEVVLKRKNKEVNRREIMTLIHNFKHSDSKVTPRPTSSSSESRESGYKHNIYLRRRYPNLSLKEILSLVIEVNQKPDPEEQIFLQAPPSPKNENIPRISNRNIYLQRKYPGVHLTKEDVMYIIQARSNKQYEGEEKIANNYQYLDLKTIGLSKDDQKIIKGNLVPLASLLIYCFMSCLMLHYH